MFMEYKDFKRNYDFLEKIIFQEIKIANLYIKLADLESKHLIYDNHFLELVEELKNEVTIENKLFDNIPLEEKQYNDLSILINELIKNTDFNRYDILYRISIIIENKKEFNSSHDKYYYLFDSFYKDISRGTLSFLNDSIYKPKYKSLRNIFIKDIKYPGIFINKELEKDMLKDNFKIDKDLYISSKLFADVYSVNSYNYIVKHLSLDSFCDCFFNILQNTDIKYADPKLQALVVLEQSFLKSCLLLLNNKDVKPFIDKLDVLEKENPDISISISLIRRTINNSIEDKKRCFEVSLCRKK